MCVKSPRVHPVSRYVKNRMKLILLFNVISKFQIIPERSLQNTFLSICTISHLNTEIVTAFQWTKHECKYLMPDKICLNKSL